MLCRQQSDRHAHSVRESWGHMTTCSHRDRSTRVGFELAGAGESSEGLRDCWGWWARLSHSWTVKSIHRCWDAMHILYLCHFYNLHPRTGPTFHIGLDECNRHIMRESRHEGSGWTHYEVIQPGCAVWTLCAPSPNKLSKPLLFMYRASASYILE